MPKNKLFTTPVLARDFDKPEVTVFVSDNGGFAIGMEYGLMRSAVHISKNDLIAVRDMLSAALVHAEGEAP